MIRAAILSLFVISATADSGCQKQIPIWRGNIYVGNSIGAIQRKQENEVIMTTDPKFNDFVCIRAKSFDCLTETYVINCKTYSKQSACGLENEHD